LSIATSKTLSSEASPEAFAEAAPPPTRRASGVYAAAARGTSPLAVEDRYRIRGTIGVGGMAVVFEAEDLLLGRVVALKTLPQSKREDVRARQRLWHEAQMASRFDHPGLCPVVDVGTLEDGSPFIAFPRLRGVALSSHLKRNGALPLAEVVPVVLQLLRALHVVHREGIVHRDVKTENLFLTSTGAYVPQVRLLDFGAAFWERGDGPEPLDARPDEAIGTTACLAPEQVRGLRDLDRRVDIYQAGLVLYECLTGKFPFLCDNLAVLLRDIAEGRAVPLAARVDLPAAVEEVIMRAMSARREDRYETAEAFEDALLRATDEGVSAGAR
jgi:serine/threonine-protein kinase